MTATNALPLAPAKAAAQSAGALRVLTVTTFFPSAAQPNRTVFVKNLVKALRRLCHVVVVAPLPWAPPAGRHSRWAGVRRLGPSEVVDGIEVLHPRFVVVPKVYAWTGFGYFLGVVGLLRRLRREPGRKLVHAHCAYPDGVGVALAARLLGMPYAVTAHGSDINVYAEHALLKPQIRWALRGANGVVAVSGALRDKISALTVGQTPRLATIACAGFDPAVFAPRDRAAAREALNLPAAARMAVFVGHLVPIKGVSFLLQAWALLTQQMPHETLLRLVLIGDGVERQSLARQAEAAGIASQVSFVGAVPQAEVAKWVAAANLLCLPSLNEGMPNVVVESLACGVPVVASRVGGIPELVAEGVNGLTVPSRDPAALAAALARVLQAPWSPEAVAASVQHLTWDALARKNLDFLESLATESAT